LRDHHLKLLSGTAQHQSCKFFVFTLFFRRQIIALAFRESKDENGSICLPVNEYRAEPARFAAAWPRDSLLEKPAAQISIDQADFCTVNRVAKQCVRDTAPSRVSTEPFRLENAHIAIANKSLCHYYSSKNYNNASFPLAAPCTPLETPLLHDFMK